MPVSLADLEATFRINLDPLRASLASAGQQIGAFVQQTRATGAGLRDAGQGAAEFKSEAERMNAELKRSLDVEAAQTQILKTLKSGLAESATSLRQFGQAATQAGRAMTLGISAPLLGLGGAALASSQKIAVAMNEIRSATGATGQQLAQLGASFRAVAGSVPQDMAEVGKAVALVAVRTGESGAALTGLSREFLTLARVTNSDVNPLVVKGTQIFRQYGIAAKDQGEALNQLFRAHEATGIGVEELTNKMLRFAPTFHQVGIGAAEAEALLGAFNRQGVVGDKALTALNITFAKWAKAGLTDAHAALANLVTAVEKAPTQFQALQVAMQAGMAGRGGADFVNAVRSGGFEFQKFLGVITGGRDTIAKAGADTLTMAQQFDQLRNKIALATAPLGEFIAQKLKDLAGAFDRDMPKIQAFGNAFKSQSEGMKNLEGGLALVAIGIGPALYGIGRLALGWSGLTTVVHAGSDVVRNFFSAEVFAVAVPAAAFAALTLLTTAYLTNFDGLKDRLNSGWAEIWHNAASGAHEFFTGVQELGRSSLSQVADDWRVGISQLAGFWRAGVAQLRGETPVTAQGIAASGFAQHLGVLQGPAATTPLATAIPRAPSLFRGTGAPPNLAGETEAQRQAKEAITARAKAEEVLRLVQEKRADGSPRYTKAEAELIARYGPATAAVMKQTEAYDAQASAIEKNYAAKVKAQQQAAQDAARRAEAPQIALSHQLQAALNADAVALGIAEGATKRAATADELMNKALASGRDDLITMAAAHLANSAQIEQHNEQVKALNAQFDQQKRAVEAIAAAELHQQEVADQLGGAGKQLTDVQKALNIAYETGDPFLIAWAEHLAEVARAQDIQLAAAKQSATITERLNSLNAQAQAILDNGGERATLASKAQEQLNAAWLTGDPALIKLAQDTLAAAQAADKLKDAVKDNEGQQKTFQTALQKTATFFQNEFTKGFEGLFKSGLKNFFPQLLADLDSLLEQMAAKILAANLTGLLFGGAGAGPGASNAAAAVGGGGGGLFGGLLTAVAGSIFGGGVGVADAGVGAAGIGPSTLTAADMAGLGAQSGGFLVANQPRLVGESGPEMFIPQQHGFLVPNHALASSGGSRGGGGGTTHIHFNISTPDVQGFRKSQNQLFADAHRTAEAHRLRAGG